LHGGHHRADEVIVQGVVLPESSLRRGLDVAPDCLAIDAALARDGTNALTGLSAAKEISNVEHG
jgi:hypothetical protein